MGHLLRTRLAHRSVTGINIIDASLLSNYQYIDHFQEYFFGFFLRRKSGKVSFLFLRSPGGRIFDTVYAYYVNAPYLMAISNQEKAWFTDRLAIAPRMGVISISTDLPNSYYPATLLSVVEDTININMTKNFRSYRQITMIKTVQFLSSHPTREIPQCHIVQPSAESLRLWNELTSSPLNCIDFNCHGTSTIPEDFNLLRAKYKGHWYYCSHYKRDNVVMVIVCHQALLRTQQDVSGFLASLTRGFGAYKPKFVIPARYISEQEVPCGDETLMFAGPKLRSLPMVHIRDIDMKSMVFASNQLLLPRLELDE